MKRINIKRLVSLLLASIFILAVKAQDKVSFERFRNNPIITSGMLKGSDGDNINGPTLIKVPNWVPGKLGKYYLYFAHHKGKYIRLAYADDLKGPWHIYQPGTLQLTDCKVCRLGLSNSGNSTRHEGAEGAEDAVTHVASPDILIDSINKELILYFHCPIVNDKYKGQYTLRATSKDGIHFNADSTILGFSYFRVFNYKGNYYSISRAGEIRRSPDGIAAFEKGPNPFSKIQTDSNYLRHAAIKLKGDTLLVFYSRIGDQPERILLSKINLKNDWNKWAASSPEEVARPVKNYEGADVPLAKSRAGLFYGKVRQLRDPYVYTEGDKSYLLYTVAGESGIAIGELKIN